MLAFIGLSFLVDSMKQYPETLVALACFLFFFLPYLRRQRGLPPAWPVVGMLLDLLSQIHRLHDRATEVLEATGCTFLFKGPWFTGMDVLITCDPANVNHIFNANFANYPKGGEFVEIFDILGGGIFNADHDSWRSQRRMTHGLMAEQAFRMYVADTSREKVMTAVVAMLDAAVEKGSVLDLQDLFLRFTFDATCLLVMGHDPCCLSPGLPVVPFAKAMDEAMEVLLFRHIVPRSWWKPMKRLRVGPEKKLAAAWETIDGFIEDHVSKKKGELCKTGEENRETTSTKPSPDMLTSCLNGRVTEDKTNGLEFTSKVFLRDMVMNLMLAGRDTTATGLSWFFWLLSKNPHVEAKILEELRANPGVCNGEFETQDLSSLVYLHAALCESLRLYPPVPFEHKGVVQVEVLPSGHRVWPELKVLVSLYSMARMEGVWGKDCREFRPERWISGVGRIRHEPSYKFMSFNCGPRTCLGKDIAFTQMKVVVATVMSRFTVEVVEGHVVVPKASIILHMKNGLMVRIKKREDFWAR